MQIQDESYIKWKLFLEGNDEAYSWLYTHHIQLLYQYGLQITPDTEVIKDCIHCLLYTSPSPRDSTSSRMPSSA